MGTRSELDPCPNGAKIHRISDFGYALPSHVLASLISIFATFLSVLNFYPPAGMTRDGHGGARTEPLERALSRVSFTDRTGQTAGVRYRYTGPVWPETGRYRSNSNLNSKNSVQPVRIGIPAGLTGLNSNPNLKLHV